MRTALFCALVGVFSMVALLALRAEVGHYVQRDQHLELERIGSVRGNAMAALLMLQDKAGSRCSSEFIARMREVAFLPDGLNTFFYAPGGSVHCSTDGTIFDPPVDLGQVDVQASAPSSIGWRINRDLSAVRRPGKVATIAHIGDFAVAIPASLDIDNSVSWLEKELVARDFDNRFLSVAGSAGLGNEVKRGSPGQSGVATVVATTCSEESAFCIVSRADVLAFMIDWRAIIAISAGAILLAAWLLSSALANWFARYWSFDERFKRNLNRKSLVLAYQPIAAMATGEITSIEVLARWRDFNGAIVPPDKFIPLVMQSNRTRQFTQWVIDQAYSELGAIPKRDEPLQVNFNIFACDFDSSLILGWTKKFRGDARLSVAVELVEQQDIDLGEAQHCVESLAAAGVTTLIDDFGTGYSNIARVARLPVKGVKLDRSFAMAPPDSLIGRMLVQVVDVMNTSGRSIIVEGVESLARLKLLRSTGAVDQVQGYIVSRPLPIDDLRAFLAGGWRAGPLSQLARSA